MSYVNIQDRRLPFALRYLGDLFAYRHLCWNLVGSDLRSRYRRTSLGILWAVIQPLAFALVIAAVWGVLQRRSSYLEFALYVFTGSVAFDLFSIAVNNGQDALTGAAGFVRQARIPFFIFQLRVVLSGMVTFLFALVGVFIFATAIGHPPVIGPHLLLVLAYLPLAVLFMLPIVMIMSNVGALFRDARHIVMLAERAVYMLSPVFLPREVLETPHLKFLEFVNPLIPFLDMIRDPIIENKLWDQQDVLVMGIWIAGLWMIALITAMSNGRKVVFAL